MRKVILVAAIVIGAALPSSAATELASCGSFTPAGISGNTNYLASSSCRMHVEVTGTISVLMAAQPGPGFTGTLYVAVHKVGSSTGIGLNGFYTGGIAVAGDTERGFNMDAGTWEFEVRAGYAIPCLPLPPPSPASTRCPPVGSAVGAFRGSLTA